MSIDDPYFTELALKVLAKKATESEQAKLKALLAEPPLAAEFKRLQQDVAFSREAMSLLGEEPASTPTLTDFERSQLEILYGKRDKIKCKQPQRSSRAWQWLVGLAGGAAVIALLMFANRSTTSTGTIQFAMLDSMGPTRGTNSVLNSKLITALQENFGRTNFTTYSENSQLNAWLNQQPSSGEAKVVYDRDAGEVRVVYQGKDKQLVNKSLPVVKEENLPAVLKQAHDLINGK